MYLHANAKLGLAGRLALVRAIACARGDIPATIDDFRAMLAEPQQPLAPALAHMVEEAVAAWKCGAHDTAAELATRALDAAHQLSYL